MVFLRFIDQKERRAYGGSAFPELQYCKMEHDMTAKRVVEVSSVSHWKNDSLYVYIDDMDGFYQSYSDIFMDGLYSNMEHGKIDVHGINYYSPMQVVAFMEAIEAKKPMDYALMLEWLRNALQYNGVYILGI